MERWEGRRGKQMEEERREGGREGEMEFQGGRKGGREGGIERINWEGNDGKKEGSR